jgi:hypothetical protein
MGRAANSYRIDPKSPSARSLFTVAPPVNSLDVFRMVVSPCPSHAAGIDVVRDDVTVIRELDVAEGTSPFLSDDLLIKQLPHFGVGPKFPVSPGVMWILDSANAQLSNRSLL